MTPELKNFDFELAGSGKSGAGGFQGPDEAPDSLRSKSYARVLHLIGEGPLDGFCNTEGEILEDAKVTEGTFVINAGTIEFAQGKEADIDSSGYARYLEKRGKGYPPNTVVPCLIPYDTDGVTAVVQAVTDAFGSIKLLRIGSGGTSYANDTDVIFEGGLRSDGVEAVATIEEGNITNGRITGFTLQSGGQNYYKPPTVRFVDNTGAGSGAYGIATISDGVVTGVLILGGGSGYTYENVVSQIINIQPYPVTGQAIKLDGVPLQNSDLTFNFKEVTVDYVNGEARQDPLPGFESVETPVSDLSSNLLDDNTDSNNGFYQNTFNISTPTTTRVRINILLNALLKQSKTTGDIEPSDLEFQITYKYYSSDGDTPSEASVNTIERAFGDNGGLFRIVNKKTSSQYEMTLEHPVYKDPNKKNHKWFFTVTRITRNRNIDPDDPTGATVVTDYAYSDSFRVSSAFAITDKQLIYPYSALVGISINAEQFTRLPTVSFRMRMLRMLVPSNYFPAGSVRFTGTFAGQIRPYPEYNRTSVGGEVYNPNTGKAIEFSAAHGTTWDGTFYQSFTNNPAWVVYNLCVNRLFGVGDYLKSVNKWLFYQIGVYSDQLVKSGYGNALEPRFTCNTYIQTQEDALKVLQDFSSIFRGILLVSEGQVIPINDAPSNPVMLFNPANVEGGEFHYAGSALSTRHTSAIVRYNDPSRDYKFGYVLVEDYEAILKFGIRPLEMTAFGTTSRGQAYRTGRIALFSENYETDIVSFVTGAIGRTLIPGMVIAISDPAKSGVDYSGRVKRIETNSAGNSVVICDRFEDIVDLDGNDPTEGSFQASSFQVTLIDPQLQARLTEISDVSELENYRKTHLKKYQITAFGSESSSGHMTLTLKGTAPSSSGPGTIYGIERTEVKQRQFRVLSCEEVEGSKGKSWSISAAEHQPNKYNSIDFDLQFDEITTSFDLADWHLPGVPKDLIVISRNITAADETEKYLIYADWQVPERGYVTGYEVFMRRNLGNWVKVGEVTSTQFEYEVAIVDTYCVKVHAKGIGNSRSEGVIDCATVVPTTDIDGDGVDDVIVPGDGEGDIPGTPGTPPLTPGVTWRTFEVVSGLEILGMANEGYWDTDDEVFKHTFLSKDVDFDWRKNNPRALEFGSENRRFGAGFGDLSRDFINYLVKIYDPNSLGGPLVSTQTGKTTAFTFKYSTNQALIGGPFRDFIIGVQAKTASKLSKEVTMRCTIRGPEQLQVAFGTPPDETYVQATVTDDGQIQFLFPETSTVASKGFRVWMHTASVNATPQANLLYVRDSGEAADTMSVGPLIHDTVYFFRVAELDDFGPGEISDEYSFTAKNPDQMSALEAINL